MKRTRLQLGGFFSTLAVLGLMICAFSFAAPASAAFTEQINYQGKLTNNSNIAVTDGDYAMQFRLCADSACASVLWTENYAGASAIPVSNGLFSVMLGASSTLAAVDFNQALYLEVSVGGETLLPRKVLGAVPNAFNTKKFDGLATTSFLRSDQANTAATINNLFFTSSTGTNLQATNATLTNSTSTNLYSNSARFNSVTTTNFYTDLFSALTGWFTNLFFTNATGTDLNLTGTASTTNLLAGNSTSTNSYSTNLNAGSMTTTNQFYTNSSGTNATSTNFFASIFNAVSGWFTNLFFTNASGTNFVATNSTTTNATSTNFFTNGLTASTANFTSATSTNFFSNLFAAITGTITDLFFTNATGTNLNLTGTASTTNLLAGNATSTRLAITGGLSDGANSTGTVGYVLQTTGTSTRWVSTSTLEIAALAAGSAGQIQYNNGSNAMAASSDFVWDNTYKTLSVATSTNSGYIYSSYINSAKEYINSATTTYLSVGYSNESSPTAGSNAYISSGGSSINNSEDSTYYGGNAGIVYLANGGDSIAESNSNAHGGDGGTVNLVFGGDSSLGNSGYGDHPGTYGNDGTVNIGRPNRLNNATLNLYGNANIFGTASTTNLKVTGAFYDGAESIGTANYVLQTTGTSTRWVSAASLGIGGSQWTTNVSDIYYTTGNVGIGMTVPSTALDVLGTVSSTNLRVASGIVGSFATITSVTTTNFYSSGLNAGTANFTSATSTNFFSNLFAAITGTITNLFFTNATGTNMNLTGTASTTNLLAGSATSTNSYSTNLNAANSTSTNAYAGSLVSGSATSTNIYSLNLSAGSANLTNLVMGNSTTTRLAVTGGFSDGANSTGTAGYVLQTTGTSTRWVSTSSLEIQASAAGANTQIQYNNNGVLGASSDFTYYNRYLSLSSWPNAGYINSIAPTTASGEGAHAASGTDVYIGMGGSLTGTGGEDFAYGGVGGNVYLAWGGEGFNTVEYDGSDGSVIVGSPSGKRNASLIIYGSATTTALNIFGTASTTNLVVKGTYTDSLGSAGSDGYVLQSTGSATKWVSTSSLAVSQWTTNGTAINYLAGNVGVGVAAPSTKLEVAGVVSSTGLMVNGNATMTSATTTNIYSLNLSAGSANLTNLIMGNSTTTRLAVTGGLSDGANSTGTAGYVLSTTGTSTRWIANSPTAAGSDTQIQFNNGGVMGASSNLTYLASAAGGDVSLQVSDVSKGFINTNPAVSTILTTYLGSGFNANQATAGNGGNVIIAGGGNSYDRAGGGSGQKTVGNGGTVTLVPGGFGDSGSYTDYTYGNDGTVNIGGGHFNNAILNVYGSVTTTNLKVTGTYTDSLGSVGSDGMVLQSTGSATKWVSTSSLSVSQWTTNGTAINYLAGNVGIGVAAPSTKLEVNGVVSSTGLVVNGSMTTTNANVNNNLIVSQNSYVYGTILSAGNATAVDIGASAANINLGSNSLYVLGSSKFVGIGTQSPTTKLDVIGTVSSTNLFVNGNATTTGNLYVGAALGADSVIELRKQGVLKWALGNDVTGDYFSISTSTLGTNNVLVISSSTGNIGVGVAVPVAKLEVAGSVSSTALFVNGDATTTRLAVTGAFSDGVNSTGTAGYVMQTTGTSTRWVAVGSLGITASAAGATGQVQYNNGGSLEASSNFVWDNTNKILSVATSTNTGKIFSTFINSASLLVKATTTFIGSDLYSAYSYGKTAPANSNSAADTIISSGGIGDITGVANAGNTYISIGGEANDDVGVVAGIGGTVYLASGGWGSYVTGSAINGGKGGVVNLVQGGQRYQGNGSNGSDGIVNIGSADSAGLRDANLFVYGATHLSGALLDSTNATGTAGYVLQTTGTSTKWIDPATIVGGTSQWTTSGANIYYNSGNVGIGTTNPQASTTIVVNTTTAGMVRALIVSHGTAGTDNNGAYIEFSASGSTDGYGAQIGGVRQGTGGLGALVMRTGGNAQVERMRVTDAGLVGIGTAVPSTTLDIVSTDDINALGTLTIRAKTKASSTVFGFRGTTSTNAFYIQSGITGGQTGYGNLYLNPKGNQLVIGTSTASSTAVAIWTGTGGWLSSGGAWNSASSRDVKENFKDLDAAEILAKISALPMTSWNYIAEEDSTVHIGPIAQDFYALFGLGGSDTSISSIDPAGVALVGIKALNANLLKQQEQINRLLGVASSTAASGNLPVASAQTFYGTITVIGEAGFESKVTFKKEVEFQDHLTVDSDTAGTAMIPSGATSTKVTFNKAYGLMPRVVANMQSSGTPAFINYLIGDKSTTSFTILLASAAPNDLYFDWIALSSKDRVGQVAGAVEAAVVTGDSTNNGGSATGGSIGSGEVTGGTGSSHSTASSSSTAGITVPIIVPEAAPAPVVVPPVAPAESPVVAPVETPAPIVVPPAVTEASAPAPASETPSATIPAPAPAAATE